MGSAPTTAVPHVPAAWYIICTTSELRAGAAPIERTLHGTPLCVWRSETGTASAMRDRCPHRGVPLSQGTVCGERLRCCYHGWEFGTDGHCGRVPALVGDADKSARRATSYPVREQQGFVWIWGDPAAEPTTEPYVFPFADKAGYLTVRHQVSAEASLHAVAENALDVPHTAFLHGGLFRNDSAERNRIIASVVRSDTGVVCEYKGEPRPEGLVAKILSPSGGVVTHFDRFIMPCIVEVEYSLGEDAHIVNAAALTPAEDHRTILYAVVSLRTRIPGWLLKPLVQPLALRIFAQDAQVLALQTANAQRFGSGSYVSTEVDLLGPHILRLLQRAATGAGPTEPYQTDVEMDV